VYITGINRALLPTNHLTLNIDVVATRKRAPLLGSPENPGPIPAIKTVRKAAMTADKSSSSNLVAALPSLEDLVLINMTAEYMIIMLQSLRMMDWTRA
jgi:hypothetical protein